MKKRIYWNMCLLALLAILLSCGLVTGLYYRNLEFQMQKEVKAEATYVEHALNLSGDAYLDSLSGYIRNSQFSRVTVINGDGTVKFDNYADVSSMENHANRPEVKEALVNGTGQNMRVSNTLAEKTWYYAVRLSDGTVLRVAGTTKSVLASVISMVPWMIVIAFLLLVLAMVLANKQTQSIIEPINRLNPDNPEGDYLYDELSPLVRKLEKQKDTIREQMDLLREKQKEFTAITENMSEGFIVVDTKADVISYNSSAMRILDVSLGEMSAENLNVLSLNRSSTFRDAVDAALLGDKNEQMLQMNDRYYHLIANPVAEANGKHGAVVVILDVTEQHSREEMRREFSANVSHELKTPLTSISGYAEIMKNGLVKPEDTTRFAQKIYDEAQRLITLVGDIIRLSRLDESDVALEKSDVDLYQLAGDVMQRLNEEAKKNQITMTLDGHAAVIHGVRQVLDEMLYNLCENAIKYNKPQGSVKISVEKSEEHTILSVADTGIGIAEADRERIFERFYRVDKSHSKQIGGTGLGLSIVKHGALYHDAEVEMDSTLGSGTIVRIIF